jgi:hypothetical protein
MLARNFEELIAAAVAMYVRRKRTSASSILARLGFPNEVYVWHSISYTANVSEDTIIDYPINTTAVLPSLS